jgi:hypothetical protein
MRNREFFVRISQRPNNPHDIMGDNVKMIQTQFKPSEYGILSNLLSNLKIIAGPEILIQVT